MSDLIRDYALACTKQPATLTVQVVQLSDVLKNLPIITMPEPPTVYIYTQTTHYDETGYYISNIDLNGDEPDCDEQFAVNNVFVPIEADRAEIQANICRNILVAAGVNVVIVKF